MKDIEKNFKIITENREKKLQKLFDLQDRLTELILAEPNPSLRNRYYRLFDRVGNKIEELLTISIEGVTDDENIR